MWKLCVTCLFIASAFVRAQDQGLYKVWLEGIKPCDGESNTIMDLSAVKVSHFNRTTITIDGAAKLLQTIDKDHQMRLIGFVKSSHGQWTKTMLDTKNVSTCDFIKKDNYFWPSIVKISDIPERCPIKQDQGLYKVWLEGIKPCDGESNTIMDLSAVKVSHFNRTTITIDGAAKLLQTIDKDHQMRLIGFVKSSHGQWTKTMLDTKNVSTCDFIKKDNYFWPSIVKISDIPERCPIKQGEYHFQDARLNIDRLPPMVPLGCYKLLLTHWAVSDSKLSSCNNLYVKLTGPKESSPSRCVL